MSTCLSTRILQQQRGFHSGCTNYSSPKKQAEPTESQMISEFFGVPWRLGARALCGSLDHNAYGSLEERILGTCSLLPKYAQWTPASEKEEKFLDLERGRDCAKYLYPTSKLHPLILWE